MRALLLGSLSALLLAASLGSLSAPPVFAQSDVQASIEIVGFRPMETTRGYLTGNPDNTFYPGDFFRFEVTGAPDGRHGHVETKEWRTFKQVERPDLSGYWYGGVKERVSVGRHSLLFDSEEEAVEAAENKVGKLNEGAAEPYADNPRAERVDAPNPAWRPIWDEHSWRVELLKVVPIADVVVEGPGDIEASQAEFEVEEGSVVELLFKVGKNARPGTYTVRFVFSAPEGGHNNPYENVEPVEDGREVEVVPYDPALWQIPYVKTNWKREETEWMLQKPNCVVTRYDGSRDENGRVHGNRRAVASAISVTGEVVKIRYDNETARTATAKLVPESFRRRWNGSTIRLALEHEPGEFENFPSGGPPETAELYVEDVLLGSRMEHQGQKVFTFAPKRSPLGRDTSFRYDNRSRYKKWSFFFTPSGRDPTSSLGDLKWFGNAEVSVEVKFWFHQAPADWNEKSIKPLFETQLRWAPMNTYQPVRAVAWELKDWARDQLPEDPGVVFRDNAWRVDRDVGFELAFEDMSDPEEFLQRAHEAAETMRPMLEGEKAERFEELVTGISKAFGGESVAGQRVPEVSMEEASTMGESLLAVAEMDGKMVDMILEDLEVEDSEAQVVSGAGHALENIGYRVGNYYVVDETVWPPGENAIKRTETASLPFNSSETAEFVINVTGDGLVAEVVEDTGYRVKVRIHAPKRAGGLKSARVYDNENDLLASRDYATTTLGWVPALRGLAGIGTQGEGETHVLTLAKRGDFPTRLEIVMTNEWGASARQELEVSRRGEHEPPGANVSLKWLILAGFFMAAWVAFARWLGQRNRTRELGTQVRIPSRP